MKHYRKYQHSFNIWGLCSRKVGNYRKPDFEIIEFKSFDHA